LGKEVDLKGPVHETGATPMDCWIAFDANPNLDFFVFIN
jgi:hypothetical protein